MMGINDKRMMQAVKSIIDRDLNRANEAVGSLIKSHVRNLMEFNKGAIRILGDDVIVNGKRVGTIINDLNDFKRGIVLKLQGGEEHDFNTIPEMYKFLMDTFRVSEFDEGPIEIRGDSVIVNGKRVGKIDTELDSPETRMKFTLSSGKRYEFDTMPELYNFIMGEFNIQEGYTILPAIDKDRYPSRDGLEGPYRAKNGKVVYYDPKEGKYYDPDTDIYIEFDEWEKMDR